MSSQEPVADGAAVDVQNVGGIDRTAVTLGSGVNVLTGRNATNRTSLLRALMGALGSDSAALKADADEGRVELTVDGRTVTRTLERRNGTVVSGGDPYLDDAELAELFSFLLESNEARQAVVRGDDLRELLLRPVDTDAIRREIEQVREQRDEIDRQLDELDELERRLPTLESRKRELEATITEKREALQEKRAEIDDADAELAEGGESPVDQKLEELRSVRSDLEDVRFRLESKRESREALAEEREQLEERLDELDAQPEGRVDEVETKLSRLREEKRSVDSLVNQLQSVVSFNRETLGGDDGVSELLADDDGDGVTDELLGDGTVTCWTCGTEVDHDRVEGTIERLEDIRQEQLDRRRDLADRIDDLEETREEYAAVRDEQDRLERKLERTTDELAERKATIEELTDERDRLHGRVEELEARVEELENDAYDELLDLHREANELEFALDDAESDLEEVEAEIEQVEAKLGEREALQTERGELTERLQDLRTRIERLEQEAVEAFNEHMDNVLDVLEYGNLARVWIERTEREVREGRRKVTRSTFDLHIVRETEDGTAYEDTVEHLSESEREVVGLVFALAGYLVHDVHEEVPFMVLDSLEAIDSERIARLVEYFEDYPDYLVVALLPEDAAALDEEYRRITEI